MYIFLPVFISKINVFMALSNVLDLAEFEAAYHQESWLEYTVKCTMFTVVGPPWNVSDDAFLEGGGEMWYKNRPLWPYLFNTWQDQTLCTSCKTSLHQTLSADDFELNVCTCPIYGPKVG